MAPKETTKETHADAKEEPAPMNKALQQHNHPIRSKIETVVENTSNITSQEHNHPARIKGKSKIKNLSNSVLNTDTGKLEECKHLRLGKDKKIWTNSFSNELQRLT